MNVIAVLVLLSAVPEIFGNDRKVPLNTFKVTFGPPNDKNAFKLMPRLLKEAIAQGFQLVDQPNSPCDHGTFLGNRYWINKDPAVILIYDIKGTIAGIQSGVPKEKADTYKNVFDYESKPFYQKQTLGGVEVYVATAYFISPADICAKGRTEDDLKKDGTAPTVYFQNGAKPIENSLKQNSNEADLAGTQWTKEKCYAGMGQHYFYNMRDDMKLDETFNFFLMFNKNELTAFGFSHVGIYNKSPQMEIVNMDLIKEILTDVPKSIQKFIKEYGGTSTLHVYFNTEPDNVKC